MAVKLGSKNELSHKRNVCWRDLQWPSTEPITSDDSHNTVSSHYVSHYIATIQSPVVTMSARIVTEYIYSSRAAAAATTTPRHR